MPSSQNELLLAIAERAEVTGVGWRSLSRFYSLPDGLNGLRVLDVCSGMSDFAYQLRKQGAEAYALDLFYADLSVLRSRHLTNFDGIARNVFHTEPNSDQGKSLYRSYVDGFEAGLRTSPSIYVGASATALPFPASSFDLVTSFNGIFGTLDFDLPVLTTALDEAIRVLRPDGTLQIVPYQEGPVLDDTECRNQREAVARLRELGMVHMSEDIARQEAMLGGSIGRLTVTKHAL
jgi:SAM-dependent methyltransferase